MFYGDLSVVMIEGDMIFTLFSREWFYLLSKEVFNPYYGLFEYSAKYNEFAFVWMWLCYL